MSDDREWLVYRVTCTVSGKCYIGITNKDEPLRWWWHLRDARTKRRDGAFHQAIRKYGEAAFKREILYVAINEREAVAVERGLISAYATLYPNGYNHTVGGETYKGSNVKGRRISEAHKEHLRRLAAAMKGKKRNPESVAKGLAKQMGHFVSEETKRKIGEANRGVKMPSEYVERRRAKNGGQWHSNETKAKMSQLWTHERKAKHKEAMLCRAESKRYGEATAAVRAMVRELPCTYIPRAA